jgi:intracellular multiplication protein IcmT
MSTADQIEQTQEQLNWHWRNTMRPALFFNLDARAVLPFCALIFYARLVTLFLAISITAIFWLVSKLGLTLPAALRKFRSLLVGMNRPALPLGRQRRFFENL